MKNENDALGLPGITPSGSPLQSAEDGRISAAIPKPPPHEAPLCEHCGAPAFKLLRYPDVEAYTGSGEKWHPLCAEAYYEHLDNAQDTNDHEMEKFGGAYGLVTWEERDPSPPLSQLP